ncbi:hypothetical protein M3Y95_01053500 [Aphelenchoides besseyi]|nr:hypothetical protein M3Y95_01053500 [Aphelenchoides besseyi]
MDESRCKMWFVGVLHCFCYFTKKNGFSFTLLHTRDSNFRRKCSAYHGAPSSSSSDDRTVEAPPIGLLTSTNEAQRHRPYGYFVRRVVMSEMSKFIAFILSFLFLFTFTSVYSRPHNRSDDFEQLAGELITVESSKEQKVIQLKEMSEDEVDYYSDLLAANPYQQEDTSTPSTHPHRHHRPLS